MQDDQASSDVSCTIQSCHSILSKAGVPRREGRMELLLNERIEILISRRRERAAEQEGIIEAVKLERDDARAEVKRLREEVAWRQRLIDGPTKFTFIDRFVDDDTLVRLVNPAQIDLEKLKDEVERLQAARDKAESRADELEAHIDRASGGEANLVALLDLYFEQQCKAERERDQARAEVARLKREGIDNAVKSCAISQRERDEWRELFKQEASDHGKACADRDEAKNLLKHERDKKDLALAEVERLREVRDAAVCLDAYLRANGIFARQEVLPLVDLRAALDAAKEEEGNG